MTAKKTAIKKSKTVTKGSKAKKTTKPPAKKKVASTTASKRVTKKTSAKTTKAKSPAKRSFTEGSSLMVKDVLKRIEKLGLLEKFEKALKELEKKVASSVTPTKKKAKKSK